MIWNVQPESKGGNGPWWNAPPNRMFEAYYMTLRVHYQMPAALAFECARKNGPLVGVGRPGGVVGLIRDTLNDPTNGRW